MFLCERVMFYYSYVTDLTHLCYNSYATFALLSGYFSKHRSKKSIQSGDAFLGKGGCRSSAILNNAGKGPNST